MFGVETVSVAKGVDQSTELHLWFGVLRFNPAHAFAAVFWAKGVHYAILYLRATRRSNTNLNNPNFKSRDYLLSGGWP